MFQWIRAQIAWRGGLAPHGCAISRFSELK
jgi:hypothetical protein